MAITLTSTADGGFEYRGFRVTRCFTSRTTNRRVKAQDGWLCSEMANKYDLYRARWFSSLDKFRQEVDEVYQCAAAGNEQRVAWVRAILPRLDTTTAQQVETELAEGVRKAQAHAAEKARAAAAEESRRAAQRRLAEAAPELLAALEGLCQLSIWGASSDFDREKLAQARAAIAKAQA